MVLVRHEKWKTKERKKLTQTPLNKKSETKMNKKIKKKKKQNKKPKKSLSLEKERQRQCLLLCFPLLSCVH